ncbi:hypothetical protein COY32_00050 [candidate division WWE3 bacterium CG_4_10_14_0_2_um_filter_41_14]|uniref:Uncharacterized protein n=1 Tax=candidate division WWE3 bacterium CG_4_10_14_0_2_um_filter_41_14 TaxID=1975072 RepID=A0A2M7TN28_UNCKA|nr:MAG: hypothetical protein COY32_00050 [candidate division WWE3 bacterium CG_4_10_14_0_2_um_filter_41_14]
MIKQNNGNIMIAVLAVVVLVGIGFWYVVTQVETIAPEPTLTPTPEIQELTSTVDTSDWIESSYGESRTFSFKYPPEWEEYMVPGGYNYRPVGDESYYVSGPGVGLNGETITDIIDQVTNSSTNVIIHEERYIHKDRQVVFIGYVNHSEANPSIITLALIDNVPYIAGYGDSSHEITGVLGFYSKSKNTSGPVMPYYDEFYNMVSTSSY